MLAKQKPKPAPVEVALEDQIVSLKAKIDELIDSKAAEVKAECPSIPLGVIRQQITRAFAPVRLACSSYARTPTEMAGGILGGYFEHPERYKVSSIEVLTCEEYYQRMCRIWLEKPAFFIAPEGFWTGEPFTPTLH